MKILIIGGTGTISAAISHLLKEQGHELWIINRGRNNDMLPNNVHIILSDIWDEKKVTAMLDGLYFDCVADFIAFTPADIERDYRLFGGRTNQYIFISSASAYRKSFSGDLITESTPLANPYWQYSRDKIACENLLMRLYNEQGFPATIIRPSHTYDLRKVPTAIHGSHGSWSVVKRIMDGKPVIIHGDGNSLWTLTHSTDFAAAFAGLVVNTDAIGEAVHITSDEALTWNQIYGFISAAAGKPLKATHIATDILVSAGKKYDLSGTLLGDKALPAVFDATKLKRLVPGFVARKNFEEGIRETVSYILAHPEYQTEDPEFDQWCDEILGNKSEE
ncbi:MAG: NAD-dependent epimerase/dehydratase family protein [Dysgonamonadaceae bacterium]|jgi:nucleoside-diphosphate-sugar epimerase|nr:NAD-dependent epimerase/dehydratase family protein [Dysgonamonadaceae bacterium]